MEDVIEESPEEEQIVYDETSENLCESLSQSDTGKAALKKISEQVLRDYRSCWEALEGFRNKITSQFDIFNGNTKAKSWPFENCANATIPIALENISRLMMRQEAELFGDWSNIAGFVPVTKEDEAVSFLLTKHMNWQIRNRIPSFRRELGSRGLLLYNLVGDVICRSYYDSRKGTNCHHILSWDEFFCPYAYTSTEPDMSDVPYKGMILHRYKHEVQQMRGEWFDVDRLLAGQPPSWDDEPEQPVREAVAATIGVATEEESERAPYKLIEYVGWADLPSQEDQRFIRAIVEDRSGIILLLQIYEEPDYNDKIRYETQMEELQAFNQELEAYSEVMSQIQEAKLAQASGVMMDPSYMGAMDQASVMPPPSPPMWMQESPVPKPIKSVPIELFRHQVCIEPVSGPIGVGFGKILTDFNMAANVVISQYIDAATLGNANSFLSADIEFEKPFTLRPGAVNKVKGVAPQDLPNVLIPLRMGTGNEQLVGLAQMLYDWGQSSVQAPDVLSGESGKSGETARGIMTRLEQATKQLSVTTRHYGDFLEGVLQNNAKLNSKFLPESEIVHMNDPGGGLDSREIRREMYEPNRRVEIRADLRFATMAQKISEADDLQQMQMNYPPLQGNAAFAYEATKMGLQARGLHSMIPLLGPAPETPQEPMGAAPVEEELVGEGDIPPEGVPGV